MMGLREEGALGDPHAENFTAVVEFVLKSIESTTLSKDAVNMDMHTIDQQIHGYRVLPFANHAQHAN